MVAFLRSVDARKVAIAVLVLWLLLALTGSPPRVSEERAALQACPRDLREGYLDYHTFEALRDLAPELSPITFAGLAQAGYELWASEQMRVPVSGNFLREDLNQDGYTECAMLLEGLQANASSPYILIASPTKKGWLRLLLQRLDGPGSMRWDGIRQAIEIDTGARTRVTSPATMRWEGGQVVGGSYGYAIDIKSLAYIRWDSAGKRFEYVNSADAPFRPWNVKASLLSYKRDYTTNEFGGVHIKFTHIDPRPGPRPGLFLFPSGYLPNVELFKQYRRPGIMYHNDDAGGFRNLPLQPRQVQSVILAIHDLRGLDAILARTGRESLSFSVSFFDAFSDTGPNFSELLLTREETKSLLAGVARLVGREDPAARHAVEGYLRMLGN